MESMFSGGADLARWFQSFANPASTAFFSGITLLGAAPAVFVAVLVVLWCVDARKGFRLAMLMAFSAFLNGRMKEFFMMSRPFASDPSLLLSTRFPWIPDWVLGVDGFSFPSVHSQTAALLMTFLADSVRKPWAFALAVVVPLLVAASRLFLGVHYPVDVLAGLALGYAIILVYVFFDDSFSVWGSRLPPRVLLVATALIALVMNAVSIRLARNVFEAISEPTLADISMGALMFGLASGYIAIRRKFRFDASGTVMEKATRILVGVSVATLAYFAIGYGKTVLPREMSLLVVFLKYGAVGFWVTCGAPFLFVRLGIARETALNVGANPAA